MNNQKRTLSPASIVSMIGAMIFAIAAACMVFLPTITVKNVPDDYKNNVGFFIVPMGANSSNISGSPVIKLMENAGNSSVMDTSLIGKTGKGYKDNKDKIDELIKIADMVGLNGDSLKKENNLSNLQTIFATAAFFGLIASAVFVCLGKALQSTGGGRTLAVIFSVVGALISVGFLIFTLVHMNELDKFFSENGLNGYKDNVSLATAPILMAAFSVVSFVFCCVGNGAGAFRTSTAVVNNYNPNAPYNSYNDGFNANSFSQPPVQPQQPYNSYNPGGYAQPQSPYAPPQTPAAPQHSPLAGDSTLPLSQINKGTSYSGDSTLPLSQINKGTSYSGDSTLPLSQINKGTSYSGDSTLPLSQINKGTSYSGDSTLPLNQMNRGSGMSGESTVSLDHVRRQSGEATVPLSRVHSMSGEGTIPLSQVGTVRANKAPGTLKCIKGDYPSLSVDLKPNEKVVIGRDPASCSVIVGADKSDVSRTHCSIWYDPVKDAFKIKDTSSNGTFVNGQKLPKDQHVQIPDDSVISLGNGDNQFKIVRN